MLDIYSPLSRCMLLEKVDADESNIGNVLVLAYNRITCCMVSL